MPQLKVMSIRLLFWITAICFPAVAGIIFLENKGVFSPPPTVIPEINLMINDIDSIRNQGAALALPSQEVGTKIAPPMEGKESGPTGTPILNESLVSFFFQSHAQQLAAIKSRNEMADQLKIKIEEQGKKIDMILNTATQQAQLVNALTQKTADLEKELNEKKSAEISNVNKILKLFTGLPVEKVVHIADDLNDETLVAIFSKMKDPDVARIMTAMPNKRVASLTLKMTSIPGSQK